MPRPKKPAGEKRRDTTEPVRIDKLLMEKIRLIAPALGKTAPEWIEEQLKPIADKQLDSVEARLKQLRKGDH